MNKWTPHGSFIKLRVKPIYIYICRHGQSHYNAQGLLQGQLDNPLTALGKEQATQLAHKAKNWNISKVVSSPLTRAQQTAQICANTLNLELAVQTGVEERHYGEWQGQVVKQLPEFKTFKQRCYVETDLVPCTGAESTATVRTRMLNQLQSLAIQSNNSNFAAGNILLVSHGDAMNCLLSIWAQPKTMANTEHVRLVKVAESFVLDVTR